MSYLRYCYVCDQPFLASGPTEVLCMTDPCVKAHSDIVRRSKEHLKVSVDLRRVARLREDGAHTWAEIRDMTGLSYGVIKRRFEEAGLPLPRRGDDR